MQGMNLWEFCSKTTPAGLWRSRFSCWVEVFTKFKKKRPNWQNCIPKWTKTTSKSATCLLCEEAYYVWMEPFFGSTHQFWSHQPDQRRSFKGLLYLIYSLIHNYSSLF